MAPLVVFLGQALFRQPLTWQNVCRDIWQLGWRQILVQGVIRTHFFLLALAVWAYYLTSPEAFYFVVVCGVLFGSITWSLRPYVDQIIYLERLPLSAKDRQRITIGRRSAILHGFDMAGVFSESLLIGALSCILGYGCYAILLWVYYWTTFNTVTQDWFAWTWFAISLWLVMMVTTVLRFLGYLDTRIRSEGWELELRVRREAMCQAALGRLPTTGSTTGSSALGSNASGVNALGRSGGGG
jgi:hypothetical protein